MTLSSPTLADIFIAPIAKNIANFIQTLMRQNQLKKLLPEKICLNSHHPLVTQNSM
jgi:hypothetical protein